MVKKIFIVMSFALLFGCDINSASKDETIDYRAEMRNFVRSISIYAKELNPIFSIVPQNGHELLTANGNINDEIAVDYLASIDGVGQEDLFYGYENDNIATPPEITENLLSLMILAENNGKKVMITDYCWTHSFIDDSYQKNYEHNFISFAADHRELDNIPEYPSEPFQSNSANIESLSETRNFLYLINPSSFSGKNEFLAALQNTNYDLLLIDLFFDGETLTAEEINSLKTKSNGGNRLILAYMSIGEAEDYRYYWNENWINNPPDWLVEENPFWEGNYKVKYWMSEWQEIIFGNDSSYLKKIIDAGFDGVYLDIIDAFEYFED